ncbi:MAG TPA: class I SAM-dependent RNA methyltransferase, partial [Halieaceae bacterium]|nr:class I SAM-dependent RNA methyltransferase [Halieaceae bacterium]
PQAFAYRNRAQFKTDGRQLGFVAAGSNRLAPITDCPVLTAPNRATLHALIEALPVPAWKPSRKHTWTTLDVDEDVTATEVVPNQRRPFRQGNDAQNNFMREWLAHRLQTLDPSRTVTELFAGSGNFTEVIAARGFQQIFAVEGV